MKLVERICFPTDFGKSSEVALESVISIAKKFGSEVSMVHVLPESMNLEKIQLFVEDKMSKYAGLLENAGIKCTTDILHGDHVEKLVTFAEMKKANLIVLGAGHVGKEKFKLGSNSEKIIRNSSVPVWLIDKENRVNPKTVLCPIDFSDESKLALENAIHLCRLFEAKLHVLHSVKRIDKEIVEWGFDIDEEQAEVVQSRMEELEESLKDVDLSGVTFDKEVRLGEPAEVILTMIQEKNIDLLMMGSTGKGALQRLLLGSVAERVTRQAPCSFIINKNVGMIHLKIDESILDIESIYNEGVQLAKQGFVQEAIVEWKRCIYKNELYFKAWSAIVKAYESVGDKESAASFNTSRERVQQILWDKQVEADLVGRNFLFK